MNSGPFIFFHFLSCSFMFVHVRSGSFRFVQVRSGSFRFVQVRSGSFRFVQVLSGSSGSFGFFRFFRVLSGSFRFFQTDSFIIFFHLLSFSFIFFDSLSLSFIFFHFLSFSFSISFSVFPFFPLFFLFSFFILLFSFCFPLKKLFPFFSFLGCSESVAALQDSLGKSAHSELALSALYCPRRHYSLWNSAHSGDDQVESRIWWAAGGSSPTFVPESPDWCLDETAEASSLLFSSLLTTVLLTVIFPPQNQVPRSRRSLAVPSQVALPFSLGNSPHSEKVWLWPKEKEEPPGRLS